MRRSSFLCPPSFWFGEQSLQIAVSLCCDEDLPDVILLIFPCVLGSLPRQPPGCIRSFLPPEHWPSPETQWVGASPCPDSYFSRGEISGLQSFTHVQAHRFARPTDSSHPRIVTMPGGRDFYLHAEHGQLPVPCSGYTSRPNPSN